MTLAGRATSHQRLAASHVGSWSGRTVLVVTLTSRAPARSNGCIEQIEEAAHGSVRDTVLVEPPSAAAGA